MSDSIATAAKDKETKSKDQIIEKIGKNVKTHHKEIEDAVARNLRIERLEKRANLIFYVYEGHVHFIKYKQLWIQNEGSSFNLPNPYLFLFRALHEVNKKVLLPIEIGVSVFETGRAAHKDYKFKSSRNTTTKIASVGGAGAGGFGGALGGSAIGTLVFPGIGTIVGGLIGGIIGGYGGAMGTKAAVGAISDKLHYNVIVKECLACEEQFSIRIYEGDKESDEFCKICYHMQLYLIYTNFEK